MSLDPSLQLCSESQWSGGEISKFFTAFNSGGVECETGEFLYSFIRLLKPVNVLETGTHFGIGASYMGLALKDNGFGHLDTIEFLPEIRNTAVERFTKADLNGHVMSHLMDVNQFEPPVEKYQMILLDTEPQTRFAELLKFYPYLNEGGYLFIHDLHRHMHQIPNEEHGFAWPYGALPEEIKQLVREDKLRPFHFPTPRGLTGFYKVAEQDYKWNS